MAGSGRGHARRRHQARAKFPDDLFPDFRVVAQVREVQFVQQQVGRLQPRVVARHAILVDERTLRRRVRGWSRFGVQSWSLQTGTRLGCLVRRSRRWRSRPAGLTGDEDRRHDQHAPACQQSLTHTSPSVVCRAIALSYARTRLIYADQSSLSSFLWVEEFRPLKMPSLRSAATSSGAESPSSKGQLASRSQGRFSIEGSEKVHRKWPVVRRDSAGLGGRACVPQSRWRRSLFPGPAVRRRRRRTARPPWRRRLGMGGLRLEGFYGVLGIVALTLVLGLAARACRADCPLYRWTLGSTVITARLARCRPK